MSETFQARQIPGTTSVCQLCKQHVVWATHISTPLGRGGKSMAFDPVEHPLGRVAITPNSLGRPSPLKARRLEPGEEPDYPAGEYLAIPHSATCKAKPAPQPSFDGTNVTDMLAWRRGER